MIVVSILLHAAIIYLIPAVDILPSTPRFIEIETVLLESDDLQSSESDVEDVAQPVENDAAQRPLYSQEFQPSALTVFDAAASEIRRNPINAGEAAVVELQHNVLPVFAERETPDRRPQFSESAGSALTRRNMREDFRTPAESFAQKAARTSPVTEETLHVAEQLALSETEPPRMPLPEGLPEFAGRRTVGIAESVDGVALESADVAQRAFQPEAFPSHSLQAPRIQQRRPESLSVPIAQRKVYPQTQAYERVNLEERVQRLQTNSSDTDVDSVVPPSYSVVLPVSQSQEYISLPAATARTFFRPEIPEQRLRHQQRAEERMRAQTLERLPLKQQARQIQQEERLSFALPLVPIENVEAVDSSEPKERFMRPRVAFANRTAIVAPSSLAMQSLVRKRRVTQFSPEVSSIAFKAQVIEEKTSPSRAVTTLRPLPASDESVSAPSIPLLLAAQMSERKAAVLLETPSPDILPAFSVEKMPISHDLAAGTVRRANIEFISVSPPTHLLHAPPIFVSAAVVPMMTSKKIMTSLEEAFVLKRFADDSPNFAAQPLQRSLAVQTTSARDGVSLNIPKRKVIPSAHGEMALPVSQSAQKQRRIVFGGEERAHSPLARAPIGLFVRKQEMSPESQKPLEFKPERDVFERVEQETFVKETDALAIEGPAARRQVIAKPLRLPKVKLDMEVTIRLKFWVFADGTVGEVIPLQRGDIRLERAAIQYLKSWRFTPLAPGSPTVWGIVPITYKLR